MCKATFTLKSHQGEWHHPNTRATTEPNLPSPKRSWKLRSRRHPRALERDRSDSAGRSQRKTAVQRSNFCHLLRFLAYRRVVVIINEADSLSRDAQAALRRTMEKYMSNMRIILCANSTSRLIAPIKSRCLLMRVAAPSSEEVRGSPLREPAVLAYRAYRWKSFLTMWQNGQHLLSLQKSQRKSLMTPAGICARLYLSWRL